MFVSALDLTLKTNTQVKTKEPNVTVFIDLSNNLNHYQKKLHETKMENLAGKAQVQLNSYWQQIAGKPHKRHRHNKGLANFVRNKIHWLRTSEQADSMKTPGNGGNNQG